jgi:hypothetical protein
MIRFCPSAPKVYRGLRSKQPQGMKRLLVSKPAWARSLIGDSLPYAGDSMRLPLVSRVYPSCGKLDNNEPCLIGRLSKNEARDGRIFSRSSRGAIVHLGHTSHYILAYLKARLELLRLRKFFLSSEVWT